MKQNNSENAYIFTVGECQGKTEVGSKSEPLYIDPLYIFEAKIAEEA